MKKVLSFVDYKERQGSPQRVRLKETPPVRRREGMTPAERKKFVIDLVKREFRPRVRMEIALQICPSLTPPRPPPDCLLWEILLQESCRLLPRRFYKNASWKRWRMHEWVDLQNILIMDVSQEGMTAADKKIFLETIVEGAIKQATHRVDNPTPEYCFGILNNQGGRGALKLAATEGVPRAALLQRKYFDGPQ